MGSSGTVPIRAARGPAPSLSREQIARAAVTLADISGIEAVSMRALLVSSAWSDVPLPLPSTQG